MSRPQHRNDQSTTVTGQLSEDGLERVEPQAVLVAGNQFALAVLDVGERAEPIVLKPGVSLVGSPSTSGLVRIE
jgi:hypothetical protein